MTTSMEKVQFTPLAIDGTNYLQWSKHVVNHLTAKELQKTITADDTSSTTHKAQALILIQHHLVNKLQQQYMNEENPHTLWEDLKSRYDHTKTVILPNARQDWTNLRVQYFKTIAEYNSELFRIISDLSICGYKIPDEDQIEKTLSTLHSTNLILST
jgi:hypothetical protein